VPWLSLLSSVLKLGGIIARMVERRGLMDQGAVQAVARMQQHNVERVQSAIAAKRNVPSYMAGDGMRDDPNRRD